MTEASKTYGQQTLWDTTSATGSLGSPAGHSPLSSQDGTDPFGQPHSHASLSRTLASERARRTIDTYGRSSSVSSASAALLSSLVSRSILETDLHGSMEYKLTWRALLTPSRRLCYRLRASARPTSGTVSSGWPSPQAHDWKGPNNSGSGTASSHGLATIAGWTTPQAMEPDAPMRPSRAATGRTTDYLGRQVQEVVGWATPTVNDQTGSQYTYSSGNHDKPALKLPGQALGMTTPSSGATSESSDEGSSHAVWVLNPGLSLWLMGYPYEWGLAAPGASEWDSWQRRLGGPSYSQAPATPSSPP